MSDVKVKWHPNLVLIDHQTLAASDDVDEDFDFWGKGYNAVVAQLKVLFAAGATGAVTLNVYASCDEGVTFDKTAKFTKTVACAAGTEKAESVEVSGIPYAKFEVVNADAGKAADIKLTLAGRFWGG